MSFGRGYAAKFHRIDAHLPPSDHDPAVHERIMPTRRQHAMSMGDTPSSSGSVLDMLSRFGINATQAAMAVAGMFFTVGGSNPAAPTTMVIVTGAQSALNEIATATQAFPALQVDGILGTATLNALKSQVGGDVTSRTWLDVYGVLRNRIDTMGYSRVATPSGAGAGGARPTSSTTNSTGLDLLDSNTTIGGVDVNTILMVGGGVLLATLLFGDGKKKPKRKKGRR